METSLLLDVRPLQPSQKHQIIFETFDGLADNQSVELTNDHDPMPLRYQFKAERPGRFTWEYLTTGPEVWKVRITKTPLVDETLADLVLAYPAGAAVFSQYGIDFCCGGQRSFTEVCAEANLDPETLKAEIQATSGSPSGIPAKANMWSLDFLADYIVQNHHQYVAEAIPEITQLLNKVVMVHGPQHPELTTVQSAFRDVSRELQMHMIKEERVLFPAIRQLVQAQKSGDADDYAPPFGSVANPIRMMEHEHADAGSALETIRKVTSNFALPADGCSSYRLLYKQLEAFEIDLHQHVHLENNILFPKAIAMEKTLQVDA